MSKTDSLFKNNVIATDLALKIDFPAGVSFP